ncbi:MAG: alpha-glucuronidase [Bacteroidetes bacterium]|nr:alpha-glucuronidase [Bacteroidota bacterium]
MRRYFILLIVFTFTTFAEDGYRLWLRYERITDSKVLNTYRAYIKEFIVVDSTETMNVIREELRYALSNYLGCKVNEVYEVKNDGTLLCGTTSSPILRTVVREVKRRELGDEGFMILSIRINGKQCIVITGNSDKAVLYGTFHFLRLIGTHSDITKLSIISIPKIKIRVLNHWDNLDRKVERGYAGLSLWDWHKLPEYIDPRYRDYARANASIGINGTVLTNVNANAYVLTPQYLRKVAALANVFRPYGLKVYLTARFSAPIEIGGMHTADPLIPEVRSWWRRKVSEIYSLIPDFGGFLVKANSEGQPGPQNYGRSHADGANMLAEALAPYNGIVMWRAFVYDNSIPEDRAKQAYNEFKPLDGTFHSNVLIQVKNGPIDFQPREPFHPLFGGMPNTPLVAEFQITQEYLGQGTHLVYLAPLFKECLDSDTYAKGEGSIVAKVIDGSLFGHNVTGIAGVANTGNERNWTGHLFGQANWYAFGRLAWDHSLSSEEIAQEWIRLTFTNNNEFVLIVKQIMMISREAAVLYMTPLGLHHIMGWDHHYGPAPWIKDKHRADWTSVYYHRADTLGIGFDRTAKGSNAVAQYFSPVALQFGTLELCPEKYLLWFHHVPWDYRMRSGRTLWEELCYCYSAGVDSVRKMQRLWNTLEHQIDEERFDHVRMLLTIQEKEARWWKNACCLYFQTFSRRPFPEWFEKPDTTLEYYQNLSFPFAP